MCGIFGIYGDHIEAARSTYFGLYALQHRGQESAGISVSNGKDIQSITSMGLVAQIFNEDKLSTLKGHIGIGHTRYSTTGNTILENAQPITVTFKKEKIAIAHNGNLVNAEELRQDCQHHGYQFQSSTDSEVIAALIVMSNAPTLMDAVIETTQKIKGAYSLVLLTTDSIIGLRDPLGVRPLMLGKTPTGMLLASEDCAFKIIGGEKIRDILPGEIVIINAKGINSHTYLDHQRKGLCAFEFIYFARPDSTIQGKNIYAARVKMGRNLFREHPVEADIVIGVPDSGIPAAIGFSKESGIPYEEGIIKNRYVGRTFIHPDQSMREKSVRIKLNPIEEVIKDKRVVVVDDSIVRGTTSNKIVQILRDAGAEEVHIRVSSPPVFNPCFYGIDTANRSELIASVLSLEKIAKHLNVDSLGYLSIDGLINAIHLPADNMCLACLNGDYPIKVPEQLQQLKLLFD